MARWRPLPPLHPKVFKSDGHDRPVSTDSPAAPNKLPHLPRIPSVTLRWPIVTRHDKVRDPGHYGQVNCLCPVSLVDKWVLKSVLKRLQVERKKSRRERDFILIKFWCEIFFFFFLALVLALKALPASLMPGLSVWVTESNRSPSRRKCSTDCSAVDLAPSG